MTNQRNQDKRVEKAVERVISRYIWSYIVIVLIAVVIVIFLGKIIDNYNKKTEILGPHKELLSPPPSLQK